MARLLLVDGDVELCEILTEYLSAGGFEVESAHDGMRVWNVRDQASTR